MQHNFELCLEYGFQYKAIATAMGSSIISISNQVSKAIDNLQKIIKGSSGNQVQEKTSTTTEHSKKLTEQQTEIIRKRMEQKKSILRNDRPRTQIPRKRSTLRISLCLPIYPKTKPTPNTILTCKNQE